MSLVQGGFSLSNTSEPSFNHDPGRHQQVQHFGFTKVGGGGGGGREIEEHQGLTSPRVEPNSNMEQGVTCLPNIILFEEPKQPNSAEAKKQRTV